MDICRFGAEKIVDKILLYKREYEAHIIKRQNNQIERLGTALGSAKRESKRLFKKLAEEQKEKRRIMEEFKSGFATFPTDDQPAAPPCPACAKMGISSLLYAKKSAKTGREFWACDNWKQHEGVWLGWVDEGPPSLPKKKRKQNTWNSKRSGNDNNNENITKTLADIQALMDRTLDRIEVMEATITELVEQPTKKRVKK